MLTESSFNGAAAREPRKGVDADTEMLRLGWRFAGASAGGRRKDENRAGAVLHGSELQWGRGSRAAERGAQDGKRFSRRDCFNGAAAREPRKGPLNTPPQATRAPASMGPRLASRG